MLIIFDFNRTLYDPDTQALVPYARRVLWVLGKRGHRLFLLSTKEPGRQDMFRRLDLSRYFSGSALVNAKKKETLGRIMRICKAVPSETVVIGDYIREEIRCGNAVGAKTIWVQRGKFADVLPSAPREEPTYKVRDIRKILKIIR